MSKSRAVRSGIQQVFSCPPVLLAELAWRWVYGLAVAAVLVFSAILYLRSLPVDELDRFALSGIIPTLFWPALVHIFSGSGWTLLRILVVLLIALPLLWLPIASLGRAATLSALTQKTRVRTIVALESLRTLTLFCLLPALTGSAAFAYWSAKGPWGHDPDQFWLVFVPLAAAAWILTQAAGGYIRLAEAVSAARASDWRRSLQAALRLSSQQTAQFTWTWIFFGAGRLLLWVYGFVGGIFLLAIAAQAGLAVTLALFVIYLLVYSVVRNVLEMGRLASWLRIIRWSDEAAL